MNKIYEVPQEMRDFADRSVAQARKAFEGFMGAVEKSAQAVEGAEIPAMAPARELSQKAANFAQSNVNAAFDVAQKLVQAKDIQEVMAIQAAYLKAQMDALQTHSQEIGSMLQNITKSKKS